MRSMARELSLLSATPNLKWREGRGVKAGKQEKGVRRSLGNPGRFTIYIYVYTTVFICIFIYGISPPRPTFLPFLLVFTLFLSLFARHSEQSFLARKSFSSNLESRP